MMMVMVRLCDDEERVMSLMMLLIMTPTLHVPKQPQNGQSQTR
jgi:hypothetical protein